MDLKDFKIGEDFYTVYRTKQYHAKKWRCTDIGTRTIIAIPYDPEWMTGPPYALAEVVFDEYDLECCYRTIEEHEIKETP